MLLPRVIAINAKIKLSTVPNHTVSAHSTCNNAMGHSVGGVKLKNIDKKKKKQLNVTLPHMRHEWRTWPTVSAMGVAVSIIEPPHGKTNNLHRRKQRRRSSSR